VRSCAKEISWKSIRKVTSANALELPAMDRPSYRWVRMIWPMSALSNFTADVAKTYIIRNLRDMLPSMALTLGLLSTTSCFKFILTRYPQSHNAGMNLESMDLESILQPRCQDGNTSNERP